MIHNLLGETWESFYMEGQKIGFFRRVTERGHEPNLLISTMTVMYGEATHQHVYSFYDTDGYPPHSYLFDTNDDAPIHVRFVGNEIICQVDDEITREAVSANTRPSYGYFPHVVTIPFEEGFTIPLTRLDDSSCTLYGTTNIVSEGWREVVLNHQAHQWWQVTEYNNGALGNRYWLDEQRQIRVSDWRGVRSYWVASREEAWEKLPASLITRAKNIFDTSQNDNWLHEVENWLNTSP